MNWRNPSKELPFDGERVWVLVGPHKFRGTLQDSIESIQMCCGVTCYYLDESVSNAEAEIVVENNDELGYGAIRWGIRSEWSDQVLAWLPANEFILPEWTND